MVLCYHRTFQSDFCKLSKAEATSDDALMIFDFLYMIHMLQMPQNYLFLKKKKNFIYLGAPGLNLWHAGSTSLTRA